IFSLTDERDVTEVFVPDLEIGCRAEAAKRLEIANEMRLVVVTAVQGDAHPLDPRRTPERPQHSLEASDSAEQLGRQPHLRLEQLDQPLRAETDSPGDFSDGWRRPSLELLQGEGDRRMPRRRPGGLRQQRPFED